MLSQGIFDGLKKHQKSRDIRREILEELALHPKSIVVLDDDPTGTQTVHNVPVVTQWSETILEQMLKTQPLFFILTNSRSLQRKEANALNLLLGKRLNRISKELGKNMIVISRGDSTLRGHYPNEVDALRTGLGWHSAQEVLAPAFFAGNRYTYKDIHYVREGVHFTPVGDTPFAEDNTFGYSSSNLRDWITEKTNGNIKRDKVTSISIDSIRYGKPVTVAQTLRQPWSHLIVNALELQDLQMVALACLKSKRPFMYRTAASFVNAISGVEPKKIETETLPASKNRNVGGLTIVGSYVPKTTAQLNYLKAKDSYLDFLELEVSWLECEHSFLEQIKKLAFNVANVMRNGRDAVVYTSRKVKSGTSKEESLEIVNKVSNGLVQIVKQLQVQPRYIIAKGGITSSDIAVKGLNVKQAMVAGQVLDGVPLWLIQGEVKFPNLPYVVFPGNVGDKTALYQLIQKLR
ncbi:MAG: four-carbon acid sugar kinase family protein [Bacteroidota bacterium]